MTSDAISPDAGPQGAGNTLIEAGATVAGAGLTDPVSAARAHAAGPRAAVLDQMPGLFAAGRAAAAAI
ncbi:hypothetical protein [Arthrobacter sp. CG_A4]|uniref:hypothetical protein n=1 Tax=Arthrobacter sp. CG_A4 TaxID=3071706 RepID=UPI002E048C65|nr:hypothetical protein [Arthrobacter sp. CG_A4]